MPNARRRDADILTVLTVVEYARLSQVVVIGEDTDLLVRICYFAEANSNPVFFKIGEGTERESVGYPPGSYCSWIPAVQHPSSYTCTQWMRQNLKIFRDWKRACPEETWSWNMERTDASFLGIHLRQNQTSVQQGGNWSRICMEGLSTTVLTC